MIFVVFVAVAMVTGAYAAGLRARETEAAARAADSEFKTAFLGAMALATDRADLDRRAAAFLMPRYGETRLFARADLAARATGLAPLDAAAAMWALDHDAVTGHASEVMPGADFRFLSFGRGSDAVLAIADTALRDRHSAGVLDRIAASWGQARDHMDARMERQRREAAEMRDRTRRAMLNALGHDFRTPLTVLKEGLARLPGAKEAGLVVEVERLRTLGENLLASARLEAGLPLVLEPVDLVDTMANLQRDMAVRTAGVELAVAIPADVPLVRAEPVMLAHLLGNVVDNAMRHAGRSVTIGCEATTDMVVVRIADDGPGIPAELAETVFEPFRSTRADVRGSGLGLAIARDLADAMGGKLQLEPPVAGQGAAFRLELPRATVRDGAE